MKRSLLMLLLAAMVFPARGAVASPCPEDFETRGDEIDALLETGEPGRALARVARLLAEAPACHRAHVWRGHIYFDAKDWETAGQCYAEAVRLNPDYVAGHVALGRLAEETGERDEALAHLDIAVSLDPNDETARWVRSWIYRELERYDEAVADLQHVVSLGGADDCTVSGLAALYRSQEDYDAANELYADKVKTDPASTLGWAGLARVAMAQEDRDAFISAVEEGLAHARDPDELFFLRSIWYYTREGDYAEALSDIRDALNLDAHEAGYWSLLGDIYYMLEDYDEAASAYAEAVQLDPDDLEHRVDHGHAAYYAGAPLLSLVDAQTLVKEAPEDWRGHFLLARNHSLLERYETALPSIEEALRLAPEEVDLLDEHGYLTSQMGDYETALASLRKSLRLEPENEYALELVAWLEEELGLRPPAESDPPPPADNLTLLGYGLAALSIFGLGRTVWLANKA